ncbi:MAG: hypothetical protein QOH89_2018 [Pseudonocardiales bacterium]|nr:hypothetical protein [Pseudonocardiales bacterium]
MSINNIDMGNGFAPDFFIIGAPKTGTTALHDALAGHPQLYASPVKEPKFFLTDGRPDRSGHRGPGDAHSVREWVWQPERYRKLFAGAPAGALRFESTPFYLWDKQSHARIARAAPDAKLIAIIRDPIDRAFSNWTHLRADGLEPERDFLRACRAEAHRIARGWAPFWRYLELGRYGEQFNSLFRYFDPAQVRVIRYRELVDEPRQTVDELCAFLGVATGVLPEPPDANVGRWAPDTTVNSVLRRAVRTGAAAGSLVQPKLWRTAQRPLLASMQRGRAPRPPLRALERAALVPQFADDNALLCDLLGSNYSDWLELEGNGTYTVRRS